LFWEEVREGGREGREKCRFESVENKEIGGEADGLEKERGREGGRELET
jgi:hypothetical protein